MFKHALVTGSKGFVGQHFVRALNKRRYYVGELDIANGPGGDCRQYFKPGLADNQWDLVVHLAAVIGGRMGIDNEPLKVATDLSIDADMLNWAVRTKQPRVVYYSSSAAYPINKQNNYFGAQIKLVEKYIDLDDPSIGRPDMSYGWAKLTGEYLAQFAELQGTRVHIFRPFSGYGPGQSLDYPFPSFIQRAKQRQDPFEIWGNGLQVRDFIHIDDIIEATLTAVEQDIQGPVNLCTGIGTSFDELALMCQKIAGYNSELKHLEDKPVGVQYRVGDPTKMLSFYKPKISLEEGITQCLKLA